MRVFMLGWEFPPIISGGLGTACHGLTKAMSSLGTEIIFVLPKGSPSSQSSHVMMRSAEGSLKTQSVEFQNVQFKAIPSSLKPYASSGAACGGSIEIEKQSMCRSSWENSASGPPGHYGGDIHEQVKCYAAKAKEIASTEHFDIIHAHDWMTYPAGIAVSAASGKPLIVHVHSTEFDRSGDHVNQQIYNIEREGIHRANKVIAVSHYTKDILQSRYGVAPDKIEVVYNAVEHSPENSSPFHAPINPVKPDKIVLFLGRITMQKGPEYFLGAAKKVLEVIDNVKFIMAGDGDMTDRMIDYAARLGIGHKVSFTRFLRGAEVARAFKMADLYVMPSVSEPFGIAPLEALCNHVPVLISKQSGVAETLKNALKVDFWDINQMANKIAAVLKYPPLRQTLRENGSAEVKKFCWDDAAVKIHRIYNEVLVSAQKLQRRPDSQKNES